MNKIDPILIKNVRALSDSGSKVQCVVYAYNYKVAKKYLSKYVDSDHMCEYPFINAFGLNVDQSNIYSVAKIDAVKYISSALKVTAMQYKSNVFLDTFDRVIPNRDISTVAVIDTGVSPHLDVMIPKKIIKFVDLVNGRDAQYDDNGHGTFVTGVLCGSGAISGGYYQGIDNSTNVIAIKALNADGETGALNILNAMQWVYDHKVEYNIKVVCMSFGSMPIGSNDPLIKGAEVLWDNGVVVVCAAGNSGPQISTIKAPGASSKIITVGALDTEGTFEVAEFSSRGPAFNNYKPDLVVPGVNIVGLDYLHKAGKYYTTMSGTSVATPMVAGVCSMMVRLNPKYTPNQIKAKLLSNCTPITGDHNAEGFGYLDAINLW